MLDRLAYPIDEACMRIGIGRTLMYDEIRAGRIVTIKIGGRALVTDETLRAYLASKLAEARGGKAK